MRRFLRAAVFGVLAIVLVLVLVMVALNIIWSRQVKAELARIEAKGEPASVADMVGPSIPDWENSALIYDQIGKRLSADDATDDMDIIRDFSSAWYRAKKPELWRESKPIIGKYEGVIAQIESAAAKPECRYPSGWWKEGGDDLPWEYHSRFRKMAQFLNADALLSAKDGRMDRCCRSLGLGIRLVNGLMDERPLMSYLGGIVVLSIAHSGLHESLEYGSFNEHQARQLYEALSEPDLLEGHRKALLGERVSLISCLSRWPATERIGLARVRNGSFRIPSEARGLVDRVLGLGYDLANRNGDKLAWLRFMDKQISGLQLSYERAVSEGLLDEEPHLGCYAVVSNAVAGVQSRVPGARFRAMARVAGDQTLLALIAYKDRYGSYPASLGELRAKLGWKIPVDPFSGKDFIYKRDGEGFILYSIGPNLKDEGGRKSPKSDPDKYDMVWRVDH